MGWARKKKKKMVHTKPIYFPIFTFNNNFIYYVWSPVIIGFTMTKCTALPEKVSERGAPPTRKRLVSRNGTTHGSTKKKSRHPTHFRDPQTGGVYYKQVWKKLDLYYFVQKSSSLYWLWLVFSFRHWQEVEVVFSLWRAPLATPGPVKNSIYMVALTLSI